MEGSSGQGMPCVAWCFAHASHDVLTDQRRLLCAKQRACMQRALSEHKQILKLDQDRSTGPSPTLLDPGPAQSLSSRTAYASAARLQSLQSPAPASLTLSHLRSLRRKTRDIHQHHQHHSPVLAVVVIPLGSTHTPPHTTYTHSSSTTPSFPSPSIEHSLPFGDTHTCPFAPATIQPLGDQHTSAAPPTSTSVSYNQHRLPQPAPTPLHPRFVVTPQTFSRPQ